MELEEAKNKLQEMIGLCTEEPKHITYNEEQAIEVILNHITKQDKMIENAKDRIEYYLMGNSKLDDFYEREKELEKLLKILNKAEESE